MTNEKTRARVRFVLAVSMIAVGILHFTRTDGFAAIVPTWLPSPRTLVLVSGVFEILGGVGLLVPRARRFSGVGLVLLYLAVFPANIHMAMDNIRPADQPIPTWVLWARLPFQFVLIALALWCGEVLKKRASALRA